MATDGQWLRLQEMSRRTGASPATIKRYAESGRIESMALANGQKRYWLEKKQMAFSAAGAKKIKKERHEDMTGKLLTVSQFANKTGLEISSVYKAASKDGFLEVEIKDQKRYIRFFNKQDALTKFAKAKEKAVEKANQNKLEKTRPFKTLAIGTMLPTKMWAQMVGMSPGTLTTQLRRDGIFKKTSLKVEETGSGEKRKHYLIEWPGQEIADKLRKVLKSQKSVINKKYELNKILSNRPTEDPVENEEVPEEIENDEDSKSEIIEEETLPEPIQQPVEESELKLKVDSLELKVGNLTETVKKLVLMAHGL